MVPLMTAAHPVALALFEAHAAPAFPMTGAVALSGCSSAFFIESGGGPYDLAHGEDRQVRADHSLRSSSSISSSSIVP